MSNGNTHALVGGIVGTSNYMFQHKTQNQNFDLIELLGVGLSSAFVGLLADIIDLPTNPHHRSLGHSLLLNSYILPKFWNIIENNPNLNFKEKKFYQSLICAYSSHLVLDSTTPMGLPLII